MSLEAGARLRSFEILGPLGVGGMGEVYHARDTKLGREVAIKVLPEAWAQDPERLARIDREARVLASLSHPNIAGLFGYEDADGLRFLAMEYVPGDTLADRVTSGPLPIREAIGVGRQIAEALEEAHAKGVIHRDLKPANIKVTPDGRVKVLDFGLAKVLDNAPNRLSSGDTVTQDALTREGMIAGTVGYMSPEQARGQAVDARSDIWAFGCVLYELLTGHRAFAGATPSDAFAAVLSRDVDWSRLPSATPEGVRTLLRRCLEKERKRRLQSIGDARLELEEEVREPSRPSPADPRRWRAIGGIVLVASLGIGVGWAVGHWRAPDRPKADPWLARKFALPLPGDSQVNGYGGLAVSPDGGRIAYIAVSGETSRVYVQGLASFEPRALEGTENGVLPSFSPDGRWLLFQAGGFYKKVPIDGGEPVPLCAAPNGVMASWAKEDLILFAQPSTGVLMSVPAGGGTPSEFLRIEGASIGVEQDPLPDGKGVLLNLSTQTGDSVAALDLETRKWKTLQRPPARWPHYLASGHLVYEASPPFEGPGHGPPPRWVATPFDLENLEVTGTALDVLGDLRADGYEPGWVTPHGSGILVYTALASVARGVPRSLQWAEPNGTRTTVDLGGREFVAGSVALSPDGQRLAVAVRDGPTKQDLWMNDLRLGTWLRLTEDGQSGWPLWSPDGARIAFASGVDAKDLLWVRSDGGGRPELLAKIGTPVVRPTSFSPDGRDILIAKGTWGPPKALVQLCKLSVHGDRVLRVFVDASQPVTFGTFSPDGRWIAFVTLESDEGNVYLSAADLSGRRWALSTGGSPVWSRTGDELFFQQRDRLLSVRVSPASGPGVTRVLQHRLLTDMGFTERSFELGTEGRLLVWPLEPEPATPKPTRVVVIPEWLNGVRARLQAVHRP